jgi:predicted RNase H-like HicB family nuclease
MGWRKRLAKQINRDGDVQPNQYSYKITWSAEDKGFIATVAEFPSLSWIARTRGAALSGLTSVDAEVLEDMLKTGEPIPLQSDTNQ